MGLFSYTAPFIQQEMGKGLKMDPQLREDILQTALKMDTVGEEHTFPTEGAEVPVEELIKLLKDIYLARKKASKTNLIALAHEGENIRVQCVEGYN